MTFEFLGTDVSTEQGRAELFDVVAFLHQIESSHLDEINLYEVIEKWAHEKENSPELKEFLGACWEHSSPEIRAVAISFADQAVDSNPDQLLDWYSRGLADEDEVVQRAAKSAMHDFLHGENESVIETIGLSRIASIIRLYKSTGFEEEIAAKRTDTPE